MTSPKPWPAFAAPLIGFSRPNPVSATSDGGRMSSSIVQAKPANEGLFSIGRQI
jgi:hypothetical protein